MLPGNVNTETNQTPTTIHLPDESQGIGVENPPVSGQDSDEEPARSPGEHVPPVEVPGRSETPEHVPEKSRRKK